MAGLSLNNGGKMSIECHQLSVTSATLWHKWKQTLALFVEMRTAGMGKTLVIMGDVMLTQGSSNSGARPPPQGGSVKGARLASRTCFFI